MRKIALMLALSLALSTSALAAQGKIGIINMKKVIATCEPGQKAMEELKSKFKDLKADLDKQKQSIETMQKELQKQSMMLSQEAKQDKEIQFKRKVRDFQDMSQNYQRKMKIDEERLSKPILEKLVDVIQTYGKKNGYTAILDTQTSGLLYADEAIDLTDKITVEMNRAWRKGK
jgi:outer membrane protein